MILMVLFKKWRILISILLLYLLFKYIWKLIQQYEENRKTKYSKFDELFMMESQH